ncbi:DUF6886 family protein [Roseixanthobacter glucoisosaccharinicivorans]|uniref:DUF6886 family protein n=1 Tax=Roseixanthobacter glucoisosaccharinicivorans TaxID=3119923 RepID=UPI00372B05B8
MRLFHFSDHGAIDVFEPRPVAVPSQRPGGREWLNGPLVWAIDQLHQAMYLFPRDCPRILLWQTSATTAEDRDLWWGSAESRIIAYIEDGWLERVRSGSLYRYDLPPASFENLEDAGMWVSRVRVEPLGVALIDDLVGELASCDVELRPIPRLTPLRDIWSSSIHASGIRLRNAREWVSDKV